MRINLINEQLMRINLIKWENGRIVRELLVAANICFNSRLNNKIYVAGLFYVE